MYDSGKWQISEEEKERYLAAMVSNLNYMRSQVGISQGDLAQVIGISRQTYSAIETGKRPLNWETFMALCFFFCNNSVTQVYMHLNRIFPFDLFGRFNKGGPQYYELLHRMSREPGKVYEQLDNDALRVIRAVIIGEVLRCNNVELEDALRLIQLEHEICAEE